MHTQLLAIFTTIRVWDIVDILVVALVLFKSHQMIKDTKAASLLKGLVVLILASFVSKLFELRVINWLLQAGMTVILIALPVVFQPELRRALEQIGRGSFFAKKDWELQDLQALLDSIVDATATMARHKIGALIAIERYTGLLDYTESGVFIDGLISKEILINIFVPNTPLHDGAIIIKKNRVLAAACLLPLTDDKSLSKELGTRHRAALGLSEQTDALIIVVSEETGTISVAEGGKLKRHLTACELRGVLQPIITPEQTWTWREIFSGKLRNWRDKNE